MTSVPSRLHPRTAPRVEHCRRWRRIGSQGAVLCQDAHVDSRCGCQLPDGIVAADRADGVEAGARSRSSVEPLRSSASSRSPPAPWLRCRVQPVGVVGFEALTGFASAFSMSADRAGNHVRRLVGDHQRGPQISAMRINEEVDALEVIGIRSVTYLHPPGSSPGWSS